MALRHPTSTLEPNSKPLCQHEMGCIANASCLPKEILKLVSSLAMLCSILVATTNGADQINWASNLDEARALAHQQNKLLLVHFWAPGCAPCRTAEANVFPNGDVARVINQYFVPLKVNGNEAIAIREHFKVDRWPTDVISTVDGKPVHRMVTALDPSVYVQQLSQVAIRQRGSNAAGSTPDMQVASNQPKAPAVQYGSNHSNATFNENSIESSPSMSHALARNRVPENQYAGLPAMPESTAVARRPGIDVSKQPSMQPPLGGPMGVSAYKSPESQLATGNRFANSNLDSTSRRPSPQTQPQPRVVPRAQAQSIQNRFAQTYASSPPHQGTSGNNHTQNQPSAPTVAQTMPQNVTQIQNPYLNPPAQQPQSNQQLAATQQATGPLGASEPSGSAPSQEFSTSAPPQPDQNMGLDGRCPVTLITKSKWRKGDARWGAVHRGYTYLFAGPEEQQKFLANPDEFSPILAGMDVVQLADVGQITQGNRRYGVLYDDDGAGPNPSRIYLFDSVASRNRFEASPESFARPVIQAMQTGNLDSLLR